MDARVLGGVIAKRPRGRTKVEMREKAVVEGRRVCIAARYTRSDDSSVIVRGPFVTLHADGLARHMVSFTGESLPACTSCACASLIFTARFRPSYLRQEAFGETYTVFAVEGRLTINEKRYKKLTRRRETRPIINIVVIVAYAREEFTPFLRLVVHARAVLFAHFRAVGRGSEGEEGEEKRMRARTETAMENYAQT